MVQGVETEVIKSPFIIADVGSNHRGDLELAKLHIDSAKDCGADACKFQLFSSLELYGQKNHDTDKWAMPREWVPILKHHADKVGIEFMCSAFSADGVNYVNDYVNIHKVASSEMLDPFILDAVKATNKPWIASTGGASLPEVEWLVQNYQPDVLLECVALYPAECSHYNLQFMARTLITARKLDLPLRVGVSDHTLDDTLSIASVGFVSTVFEKHFDAHHPSDYPGDASPDTCVSLNSDDLYHYCKNVRAAFSAIGNGHKSPAHQHDALKRYRRRPIVTRDLKAGDTLKLGENFGSYRSLVDDIRGAPAQLTREFDNRVLKVDMKLGSALWFSDVE